MKPLQRLSLSSLLIEMHWNDHLLASGTGFFASLGAKSYLVTNRHNLSGRHAETNEIMSSRGVTPTHVRVRYLVDWSLRFEKSTYPLLSTDTEEPLWLEHAYYGRKVDVVALEVPSLPGLVQPVVTQEGEIDRFFVAVNEDVAVVGYPFGSLDAAGTAIWARGTIASEPEIQFGELPRFVIDSRTRTGMSGSPVVMFAASGTFHPSGGGTAVAGGPVQQFLGVYSGRISPESDLGYVWHASVLREILTMGNRHPAIDT